MTCYHPIRALIVGETDAGKKKLKFVSKDYDNTYKKANGETFDVYEEVLLPCGKCIGCTVDRSRQWATRLMLELKYHEKACFVTLTYNDEHLPACDYIDQNGNEKVSYTLNKGHLQKFMKRLRRHYEPQTIRFFACGEYGSKSMRPHYHLILFGVDFSEDRYIHEVRDGYVMYRSPTLEKIWTDPETKESYGFSLIAQVNWNTCAYVSRYCTKKKYGKQNIYYQTFNLQPEFNLMSRRPGIGAQFYKENGEQVYINQEIFLSNNKGGLKVRPPAYFDRLYDIDHHEEMEEIKKNRKEMAENAMALKLERTSLNLFELLEVEERYFKERISSLRRDKV